MNITTVKEFLREKTGISKLKILSSPIFIAVFMLKLFSSAFFASDYLTKLFAPFVNYYVISGFSNPYDYFFSRGILDIFPYPQVMLWFLAIPRFLFSPFFSNNYLDVTNLQLVVYRLPILISDLIIFIILVRWLKHKQDKVLWFYWCSPILFYINYLHGQLDVIPMMLLFVALYLLFKEKFYSAMVLVGLAISAKTGVAIVLPFIFVFLILRRLRWQKIIFLLAIILLMFVTVNSRILLTPGFTQLVLNNKEQLKIFDFNYALENGLVIYFVPLAFLLLFIKSLTFKSINRSLFLMFLSFGFGILTLFIPPMPGWYYWIVPFFIYFYIKDDSADQKASRFSFVLLNVFYFAYFISIKNSDFSSFLQPISGGLALSPNLYHLLLLQGIDVEKFVSVVFTLLQTTLLVNVAWIYKRGVENHMRHKIKYQPYLIGLAGDSGSGKTTFCNLLLNVYGENNLSVIHGDDMHRWERGDANWKKFTHLNPLANRLHTGLEHATNLKHGETVNREVYDHDTGHFTAPQTISAKRVLLFEGLHSLYFSEMRNIFDLKIFLQPEEQLRCYWKIARDMKERGYTRQQILEQIKSRENDSLAHIQKQELFSDITISFCSRAPIIDWGKELSLSDIYLKIKFKHELNVEPLTSALGSASAIKVAHYYDEHHQYLEFNGEISADEVSLLGHRLIPDLDEVVVVQPAWQNNLDGLIQLFVNYYIFYKVKAL
ncbi:MAG: hypothetical protein AAB740_01750 [Patescibacteria group bacterium]